MTNIRNQALDEAADLIDTMAERPYDNEPEFNVCLRLAAMIRNLKNKPVAYNEGEPPSGDVRVAEPHKPHNGRIEKWRKVTTDNGLGYLIRGYSLDHPHYKGSFMYTSYVVRHDEASGEIETLNSRYTLV